MDWLKFTAWPWMRDRAFPLIESSMGAWWESVEEHPGVAVTNIVIGAFLCAGASLYL